MAKKAVLIASGGMDSVTMAYLFKSQGYDVHLVGFDYGQRHKKELDSLIKIGNLLGAQTDVVDLSVLTKFIGGSSLTSDDVQVPDGHYSEESMRITVVPNRNAIMLSIATGIAVAQGAEVVATGIHAGDHFIYPDCRPSFFAPFADAMAAGTDGHHVEGFHLTAPFITLTKADIALLGNNLQVPYEHTWSCYKGGDVHCARCGTCVERIEAFIDAGVDDPTEYAESKDFAISEIARKAADRASTN
jgi:7-cyano-7-deazaguanine synthase